MKKVVLFFTIALMIMTISFSGCSNVKVDEQQMISLADSTNEAVLLNKIVLNQNRWSDCADEVATLYQEKGIRTMTPAAIEKTKKCKSSLQKTLVKKDNSNYVVVYTQTMPEGCGSSRTVSNLLNVSIDITTDKTISTWDSRIKLTQAEIDIIENSLKPADCKAFADFIGSHGSLN